MPQRRQTIMLDNAVDLVQPASRRDFLRLMAAGGTIMLLPTAFAACDDEDDPTSPGITAATIDFSDDLGTLNYIYALKQIQSAFYVRAVQESRAAGFNPLERRNIADLRNHEFIQREALRALLGGDHIGELRVNGGFASTDFRDRVSILESARELEDLGVAALTQSARYLTDPLNLVLIAKISSVEARHSAVVRDMLDGLTDNGGLAFAGSDIVVGGLDATGLPATPTELVAAVDAFLDATVSIANQPA